MSYWTMQANMDDEADTLLDQAKQLGVNDDEAFPSWNAPSASMTSWSHCMKQLIPSASLSYESASENNLTDDFYGDLGKIEGPLKKTPLNKLMIARRVWMFTGYYVKAYETSASKGLTELFPHQLVGDSAQSMEGRPLTRTGTVGRAMRAQPISQQRTPN